MSVRDDQPRECFRYLYLALTLPSPKGRGEEEGGVEEVMP
jgi:hypothetical protein